MNKIGIMIGLFTLVLNVSFAVEADGMVKLNKGGRPYMIVCDHEVTQSEYESVMEYNPSFNKADGNLPVEMVSWYDAVKYCNKRSEKEELTPCYVIKGKNVIWNRAADGYRLPTVDEYKDAAGLSEGNNANDDNAWTLNNSDNKTHIVKQKKANSNNLYDMTGNVAEWCWSDNKSNKSYNVGAWNVPDSNAGNINEQPAINKNPALGFRVVRNANVQEVKQEKFQRKDKKQRSNKNVRKTKEESPVIDIGAPSIDIDSVKANVACRTFGKTVEIKNIKVHKTGILKNIRYSIKDMATNETIVDKEDINYQKTNVADEFVVDTILKTFDETEEYRILSMKLEVTDVQDQTAAISFPFVVDSMAPVIRKEFVNDEQGMIGIMDNVALKDVKVNIQSSDKSWKQDDTLLSPDGKGLPYGEIVAIELPKLDVKKTVVTYTITVTAKDAAGNETKEEQKLEFKGDNLYTPFIVKFTAMKSNGRVPSVGPKLVLDSNQVNLSDISNVVYAVMPVEATGVRLTSPQQRIEILGVEVNKEFGLWMMRFSSRDISLLPPGDTQFALVGFVRGIPMNIGTFSIVNTSSEPN